MLIDKIKEHFRLLEVIQNDLTPYINVLKKYDTRLLSARYGIDIKLEDGCILVQWYNGYEDESTYITPEKLGNSIEDFEKTLIEYQEQKMLTEKLAKEKQEQEWEESQRKQYELLKKKFENN